MLGGSPGALPNITGPGFTILYYVAPVSLSSHEAHFGSAEQSAEEQLHQCSVCVTLQNINGMKKCETMPVWLSKMVLAQHFAEFAEAGNMAQQSLTPALHWLECLIAPGGFLLAVSHLFAVLVFSLCVGLGKSK